MRDKIEVVLLILGLAAISAWIIFSVSFFVESTGFQGFRFFQR